MDHAESDHLYEPHNEEPGLPQNRFVSTPSGNPHLIVKTFSSIKRRLSANPSLGILLFGLGAMALGIAVGQGAALVTFLGALAAIIGLAGLMGLKRVAEETRLRNAQTRFSNVNVQSIDSMSGHEFEELLVITFEISGNIANHTGRSGDFGADILLIRDGVRTVVQAKRSAHSIGPAAIQEVTAARAHWGAQKALVVTNSTYTTSARLLAKSNQVDLWDRSDLIREVGAHLQDLSEVNDVGLTLLKSQLKAGMPRLLRKFGVACLFLLTTFFALLAAGSNSGKRRRHGHRRRRR